MLAGQWAVEICLTLSPSSGFADTQCFRWMLSLWPGALLLEQASAFLTEYLFNYLVFVCSRCCLFWFLLCWDRASHGLTGLKLISGRVLTLLLLPPKRWIAGETTHQAIEWWTHFHLVSHLVLWRSQRREWACSSSFFKTSPASFFFLLNGNIIFPMAKGLISLCVKLTL